MYGRVTAEIGQKHNINLSNLVIFCIFGEVRCRNTQVQVPQVVLLTDFPFVIEVKRFSHRNTGITWVLNIKYSDNMTQCIYIFAKCCDVKVDLL